MNNINNIALFFLLAIAGTLQAQTKTKGNHIEGSIKDENQHPLDFVTVSLIRVQDSTLFKTALTDEQGKFIFATVPESDYKLVVTQIGRQKYTSSPIKVDSEQPVVHLDPVTLKTDSKELKEVTVTVQKPLIERQGDKLIINVENSSVSAGSTALEVLQKAPGITLDKDDNVALKGKGGVLIMIDGKPTYLSSADLASMLRNMQSNEIEAIEIISNPSARYEAEGKSGIINIRLKKNKNYGT
ncbi:TonB-dependent receptor, partial [Arcticibacter svalbardensis]|uniref:TonB-dependent receptor n=1 Tax=Arcticibacter svalbardensis TaxID=1288027 RepID=UPI000590BBD7